MSACASPAEPSIMFALLAAGGATRFGGTKLDQTLGGKPLWRWSADAAVAAGLRPGMCIVRDEWASARDLQSLGWSVLVNPDAETGIASSIKLALAAAEKRQRLVIGLADMPFVTSDHLRQLAASDEVAFTRYSSGRLGVPAAFPRDAFAKLAMLHGDRGAASLDWGPNVVTITPVSQDMLIDVDTPDDLLRAQTILERR